MMNFWLDPFPITNQWLMNLLTGWGIPTVTAHFILEIVGAGAMATGAMLFVIFLIWLERKVIGRIQDRLGPNRVGPWGIFQPFADMLKIFTKEYITPAGADVIPYNLAPILNVASVLLIWAVIPFMISFSGVNLNVGILYIIAAGGLGALSLILAGWGSNNKYALLGAFRGVAQLISYEVPMVLSLLVPVMFAGSMGMNDIVKAQSTWFIFLAPLAAFVFFVTSLAEVGRSPFDLVEAESEIVAGFNIEYSGLKFGMFYVGEFLHAFTISLLFATIFLGGWRGPGAENYPILGFIFLFLKTSVIYFLVILFRGSLPRFRIDQMMDINWKFLTPISLAVLIVTALADKLVSGNSIFVRLPVLWAVNLAVIFIVLSVMRGYVKAHRRAVVSTKRPLAVPDVSTSGEQP
jgi:NADH-quinone oxidoreductase subunit H